MPPARKITLPAEGSGRPELKKSSKNSSVKIMAKHEKRPAAALNLLTREFLPHESGSITPRIRTPAYEHRHTTGNMSGIPESL
ncbi:MAG: hypothetical protein E4G71_03045 [Candidatus Atribacteria bacterium]|nr:MAG: hypothetical protein E4G71_03045 [Candidatus Atribacteria bacterium]